MTKQDAIKILTVLKAAYPNSFKGMTKEEANGTITVWAIQFSSVPMELVMIAVNKIISKNPFAPTISEVKKELDELVWEARKLLKAHYEAVKPVTIQEINDCREWGFLEDEDKTDEEIKDDLRNKEDILDDKSVRLLEILVNLEGDQKEISLKSMLATQNTLSLENKKEEVR